MYLNTVLNVPEISLCVNWNTAICTRNQPVHVLEHCARCTRNLPVWSTVQDVQADFNVSCVTPAVVRSSVTTLTSGRGTGRPSRSPSYSPRWWSRRPGRRCSPCPPPAPASSSLWPSPPRASCATWSAGSGTTPAHSNRDTGVTGEKTSIKKITHQECLLLRKRTLHVISSLEFRSATFVSVRQHVQLSEQIGP